MCLPNNKIIYFEDFISETRVIQNVFKKGSLFSFHNNLFFSFRKMKIEIFSICFYVYIYIICAEAAKVLL